MKLSKLFTMGFVLACVSLMVSCGGNKNDEVFSIKKVNINESTSDLYTNKDGVITFKTATAVNEDEDMEVILKGEFAGQIVNEVEGLVIVLNGVKLENDEAAAIVANAKTEISTKKDTVNYITVTGETGEKTGAVESAKDVKVKFGGAGTCYISDTRCHGIKCDKVEFKGSGVYDIKATADGSAVNCNKFEIEAAKATEPEKMVTLKLSNAKNGIKADKTISILNGKLYFESIGTALKTDKAKSGATPLGTSITLENCSIELTDVSNLYTTETYTAADNVVIKNNNDE